MTLDDDGPAFPQCRPSVSPYTLTGMPCHIAGLRVAAAHSHFPPTETWHGGHAFLLIFSAGLLSFY